MNEQYECSKNYYAVLGVNTEASAEEIKRAYIDKCFILHPDRLQGAPETAKISAEEELKKVNEAYAVLKDSRKRNEYDKKCKADEEKFEAQKNKPKPVINPTIIRFEDVRPGEIRTASFVINNNGGQYSRIWFSNPDTWVRVTNWHSISNSGELPLQVNIEIEGQGENRKYSEAIKVTLDDEEADVIILLTMQKEPHFRGYYLIVAKHTGRCLDVRGRSKADEAQVFQWVIHGGDNQRWKLQRTSDGYYHIIAKHSQKCLDVAWGKKEDYAQVFQYRPHDFDNQKWNLQKNADDSFCIVAKHSGKALQAEGSRSKGAKVVQYHLTNDDSQKWELRRVPIAIRTRRIIRKCKTHIFGPVLNFLRTRWFLITLGLAIVFLSISYWSTLLENWPWGGEDAMKWMELPIEAFGSVLVLIGILLKHRRARHKAIRVALILFIIVAGATFGYHRLDESGKIDAWLNRSSDEGTIAGSLRNLIQESGGTQFISVEEFDDSDSQHAGSTSCTPELPEGAILTPVGTILLPDLGDTGIAINGTVVNPRAFMKPGVEEALSKACVFPNESGWAKIEATKLNDIEQLKLKEEEAKNAKLAAELAAQEALDAAEKARIAAELERLAEEQAKAALTSRVWSGSSYLVGGDWQPIIIVNNPEAKNPSWNQLTSFLKRDDTDKHEYDYGSFVCADFAEMLHNNAEDAGWRCAYVSIELSGYPDFYNLGISSNTGHALNAFETTDRGLVYIDSTNSLTGAGPTHGEALVEVKVGEPYNQEFIFPSSGWFIPKGEMGTVTKIDTIQW